MKKLILLPVFFFLLLPFQAFGCTNTLITVGALDTGSGKVLAELVAGIIYERTGIMVGRTYYRNSDELYAAVRNQELEIIVENSENAFRILQQKPGDEPEKNFELLNAQYQEQKGLVWMKPFGFGKNDPQAPGAFTSALIKADILNSYPGLYRVVSKLSGVIDDATLAGLLETVKDVSNDRKEIKKAARNFLVDRKLI